MNSKLPVAIDIQDIWQKDKDHVIHPWTDFSTFQDEGSLIMSKGENAYVYDAHGNKYLDGIGGLWCVNIAMVEKKLQMRLPNKSCNCLTIHHSVIKPQYPLQNLPQSWLSWHLEI